jgi:intracellular sulfur oxidation DsrE/DsrF family protein
MEQTAMNRFFSRALLGAGLLGVALVAQVATAGEFAWQKVVIQVSTDDVQTQNLALNNAVNLQKDLGMDNVDVVVVAYGPGLSILTEGDGSASKRVPSLAIQGIQFNACGNTMKKVASKTGKEPKLVEGVEVVPAGVVRIMELQEQGYSYIRP